MKKFLAIILVLMLLLTLVGCATVDANGSETVAGVAIREGIGVLAAIALMLINVGGAWLLAKLNKRMNLGNLNFELSNIAIATEALIDTARITVGELQQTIVDKLKIEAGGKLTSEQISELKAAVYCKTIEKMDEPTMQLLEAAGKDIEALIAGVAEDWVLTLKG